MSSSLLERSIRAAGSAEAFYQALSPRERAVLLTTWAAWARPEQLEPDGLWRVWLILAGRGFGKSRTGSETVRGWALKYPGCHIALVGRTAADVRDVMVRALLSPWNGGALDPESLPLHIPSTRSIIWKNGSRATTYSADEPRQLLGQNHDLFWADELAAWPSTLSGRKETGERSVMEEVWHEGLMMSLRGSNVDRTRGIVTTTPRPKKLIRELVKDPSTIITRGSTYDNAANLPAEFLAQVRSKYEGTRLGRQEIHAEVLDDVLGALWTHAMIDDNRVSKHPDLVRVVIGVDPSGKSEDGDSQGIVVCGKGTDGQAYVLADRTTQDTPDGWGARVVQAWIDFKADKIFVERNFGGDMATFVIKTAAGQRGIDVVIDEVTASRGKVVRAEPISALYEQGRVHHVGEFPELETQMREYVPEDGRSPDRMDALVWAMTDLMERGPTIWERLEHMDEEDLLGL